MTEGYCLESSREAEFCMAVSQEQEQENDRGSLWLRVSNFI